MSNTRDVEKRIERLEETHSPWQPKPWVREEIIKAFHDTGYHMQEVSPGVTVPIKIEEHDWDL